MEMATVLTANLLSNCLLAIAVVGLSLTLYRLAVIWKRRSVVMNALKRFPSPPGHWLLGNLIQESLTGFQSFRSMLDWAKVRGKAVVVYYSRFVPRLLLTHYSTAKVMLKTPDPKADLGTGFLTPWLGEGLLFSSGKKWARSRRLLTPAFHFEILKNYVPVFSQTANTLVSKWKAMISRDDSHSLEMLQNLSLLTLDSLLKCIFGVNSSCQANVKHPYIEGVSRLNKLVIERFVFYPYHWNFIYHLTWSGYQFRKWLSVVHNFSEEVIRTRKAERVNQCDQQETSKSRFIDFLDILLDARDEDGNGLTDLEIRNEVDTFMFAGHDTTASGTSWCLYNLAANPECQEKCRQEIMDALRDRNDISWEDVAQHRLPYLTQCIKESLRLNPPVTMTGRQPTRPICLPDGNVIPKDAWVGVHLAACHRDPSTWSNPECFDPDRFSADNCRDRPSHAFMPFSAGPRNCIGQQFAMLEMKTVLCLLLKHFTFQPDDSRPPPEPMQELVLKAKHGIWLQVRSLDSVI